MTTETSSPGPQSPPPRARRVLVVVTALLALLVISVPFLPLQGVVRDRLVTWLDSVGIVASIGAVNYDLLRLRASATEVRLSTPEAQDAPFLTAERISVDVPATILRGIVSIQSLQVEGAEVLIRQDAEGRLDLPAASGDSSDGGIQSLPIGELSLQRIDLRWRNEATGDHAALLGVELTLDGRAGSTAQGSFRAEGVEANVGGVRTSGFLDSALSFDSRRVTLSRLEARLDLGSLTSEGGIDVLGASPMVALDLSAAVETEELRLVPDRLQPSGELHLTARVEGPRDSPRVVLGVDAPALTVGKAGPWSLEGQAEYEQGIARIEHLGAELLGGTLTAGFEGQIDGSGRLEFEARGVSLHELLKLGLDDVPFEERSRLDLSGTLSWAEPSADAIRGSLQLGLEPETAFGPGGQLRLDVEGGGYVLDGAFGIAAASVGLRGAGRLARDWRDTTFEGRLTGAVENLATMPNLLARFGVTAALPEDIAGRVELDASLAGSWTKPTAEGQLQGSDLAAWGVGPLSVSATMDLEGRRVSVRRASVEGPMGSLQATGRTDLNDRDILFEASGTLTDLSQLAEALPIPVEGGEIRGEVTISGSIDEPRVGFGAETEAIRGPGWSLAAARIEGDWVDGGLAVRVESLAGHIGGSEIALSAPSRLAWVEETLTVEPTALRIGDATELSVSGTFPAPNGPGLNLALRGEAVDLGRFSEGAPEIDGPLHLELQARGALDRVEVTGRLDAPALQVCVPGADDSLAISMSAQLGDGALQVTELRGSWSGVQLAALGTVPLGLFREWVPAGLAVELAEGTARLGGSLEGLTPRAVRRISGASIPETLDGELRAHLHLEADAPRLEAVSGRLLVDRAELVHPNLVMKLEGPAEADLASGVLKLEGFSWSSPHGPLGLAGRIGLTRRDTDLRLAGDLDLRILDAFLPVAAEGLVEMDLRFRDDDENRALSGSFGITGGGMAVADPPIDVTALQGRIDLLADEVRIAELSASINGGTLQVEGGVSLDEAGGFDLSASADGIGLTIYPELRGEVDVDMQLTGPLAQPWLGGRLTLAHASYRGRYAPNRVGADLAARWAPPARATLVNETPSPGWRGSVSTSPSSPEPTSPGTTPTDDSGPRWI